MNKFIENDLHNGKIYLYCGMMNVIANLENNQLTKFDFGEFISYALLTKALEERGWTFAEQFDDGREMDFLTLWESPYGKAYKVSGNLVFGGLKIELEDETD